LAQPSSSRWCPEITLHRPILWNFSIRKLLRSYARCGSGIVAAQCIDDKDTSAGPPGTCSHASHTPHRPRSGNRGDSYEKTNLISSLALGVAHPKCLVLSADSLPALFVTEYAHGICASKPHLSEALIGRDHSLISSVWIQRATSASPRYSSIP
jgi:hypothetical protein